MPAQIPERHSAALADLISMSDEQLRDISSALAKTKPTISPQTLAKRAAEKTEISSERFQAIIEALTSLIISREQNRLSSEQVAADISRAAAEKSLGGLQPSSPKVKEFEQRLVTLLALEQPLGISARALNVLTQHKNVFQWARILTDMRGVFSQGDSPKPIAAMIIHNLEIATFTDNDLSKFFAALDTEDLRALARVIDRAIKKERTLKDAIERAGLPYVEVVSSED